MNKKAKTVFILAFFLLLSAVFVLGDNWNDGLPSHSTLYANVITSMGVGADGVAVTVDDPDGLQVSGDVCTALSGGICLSGVSGLWEQSGADIYYDAGKVG
ncbi:hypothetical protein JXB11_04935, partial [Candidatus Woesearchaeota archaeon]|nr:hypothetical protein [Candidatus Woesearchaeota archaeon]